MICLTCKELEPNRSNSFSFCSVDCQALFASTASSKWTHGSCEQCDRLVSRYTSQIRDGLFCCKHCADSYQTGKPFRHDKQFKPGQAAWNKGLTRFTDEIVKRIAEAKVGTGNPNYINGQSKGRSNKSPEYRQWRTAVFKRDDFKCQWCPAPTGTYIEAHHIKSWAEYKDLRYEVSNGMTLCRACHNTTKQRRAA